MRITLPYLASFCLVGLSLRSSAEPKKHNVVPPNGLVPNAKTAVQIAVAVWSPIYGEKHIQGERPFKATLSKGIWTVEGSLPRGTMVGGVAIAEIAKRDGRIVRISHGK